MLDLNLLDFSLIFSSHIISSSILESLIKMKKKICKIKINKQMAMNIVNYFRN